MQLCVDPMARNGTVENAIWGRIQNRGSTYLFFGKSNDLTIFTMVEWILDICQFIEIAHEARLLLALHVHFDLDVQWGIGHIVHGWIVCFTMRLNGFGHCVQRPAIIFPRIRTIGGY